MAQTEFQGLFVPTITVFKEGDQSIDHAAIQEHVDHLIATGVDGLIPNGSTGDFHLLTLEERQKVAESVIARAAGRVPVIVGATCLSTAEVIRVSLHAQERGAAGVMVAPAFYLPMSRAEILAHFQSVARAIKIPLVVYNNPLCTGQHVSAEMIAVLEKSVGVRYVKESSGVFDNFQQILVSTGQRVKVFMGEEALSLEALLMGAAGLIMGLANAIPDRFVEMLKAVQRGDIAQARLLHYQTLPLYYLANEGATHNYNSVIKSVIKLRRGKGVTSSRAPSLPLTDPQEGKLAELLDRIGLGQGG